MYRRDVVLQVRNMSDQLWESQGPALEQLHETFSTRLQHLTNNFHNKLARKMDKWFRKGQKTAGKKGRKGRRGPSKEGFDGANQQTRAKTKRRVFEEKDFGEHIAFQIFVLFFMKTRSNAFKSYFV